MSETLSWIASNPLYHATLLDWFDILVLAALIYKGLTLMRGTRALQSLLGLVLLGLIYFISGLIGMTSLNWVLDNLMVYVVLAGVVQLGLELYTHAVPHIFSAMIAPTVIARSVLKKSK